MSLLPFDVCECMGCYVQLITEDMGLKLENITPDMLGHCKKVTVSKDDTIILDGGGNKAILEDRTEQVGHSCHVYEIKGVVQDLVFDVLTCAVVYMRMSTASTM